ncbi:telomere length regulator protein rif1 [Echria macrotheca]|uniref:Telomere length regulator protein rif1 n=1 Tax=Echria macrotheca TaxID=438768 RepID=A0AAJ0BDF2_9PEZI|nr:telomere length regulator protein rif1 [Echria macrotheca]
MSSILESLPPRPPTPPRETHHDATIAPRIVLGSADSRSNVHTPPGAPSPGDSITTNSTTRRSRKRVEFSAKAEYKDPPVHIDGQPKPQHPTPVSLPRSASKPVKSILKVTQHPQNPLISANGDPRDPSHPDTPLAEMLESTIQQLAGGDRDSKVDAYVMLARACKSSNNLPDRVALQEKMGLFMQFIQRDMVSKPQEGPRGASLVNHALNLLITFLGFPSVATSITNEFGVFVIDHCIRAFDDVSVPKDITRHLMKIVSLQNFSAKVMTVERVGRLITSLHNIKGQRSGKSIVMSRVLIYRKLVKQCKQLMVHHSDWLLDLFLDMLSSLRDIRLSAINLGLEAAFTIGHEKQLSRKVRELFQSVSEDEEPYIKFYRERLEAMAKDKSESAMVPDIWSVVILLLRIPMAKWDQSKPWLELLQRCFNSQDFATKANANRAWSRLVYMTNCDELSSGRALPMLAAPFISQVRRKGAGKMTDDLRQTVLGGICNLFYYTFKPNTSPAQLDGYWDGYVRPIISALLDPKPEAANDNIIQAALILRGLFDCRTPRRWREDHIVDSPLVKPDELPTIEPQWVRSSASKIFGDVGPILEKNFLTLASTDSAAYKLWQALVTAIASAASKEIKVSKDTANFVNEALGLFQRIWTRGLPENGDSHPNATDFLLAARAYLEVMISSLGHLPFTEKPGKTYALSKAPLFAMFSTLSALPPGVPDDDTFADFFSSIFSPFFAAKGNKASMDFAQELLAVIPMESPRPYGPWLLVSGKLSAWLGPNQHSHQSTASGNEVPLGNDFREIVRVLERGIRSTPNLPWDRWESLFYALFERVRDETGDAGFALVAIEPLAKALLDGPVPSSTHTRADKYIRCVTELLSVSTHPRDRQAFDAARRRLWGTALAGGRFSSFDPFDNFYKVISGTLKVLYEHHNLDELDGTVRLLKELGGFFDRCNRQLFIRALQGLQDGFLPWIEDGSRLLSGQSSTILAMTKSLWDKVSNLVSDMKDPENQLESLEPFFCATFDSSHRNMVNAGVSLWNKLFEHTQHLEYPDKLKVAVSRLSPYVEMVLPGLDLSNAEPAGQQPMFVDSMEDFSLPRLPSTASSRRGTPRPPSSQGKTPDLGSRSRLIKSKIHKSSATKSSGSKRRNAAPRLRHDDSQLQFAPIETSPLGQKQIDSQVLTEHQKEVRERQRENAVLFPDMRSSPGPKTKDTGLALPVRSQEPSPQQSSRAREAATPEPEGAFDSYISSTPTPRRGQPVLLPENDLTDLPSSPPEPRGNPLAAEIRSRSASHSLLDDWAFSSSPVSGSPNPVRQVAIVGLSETEDLVVDNGSDLGAGPGSPSPAGQISRNTEAELDDELEDVIEDTILPELPPPSSQAASKPSRTFVPATPQKPSRPTKVQETPKSDNDVFVDAPTSPLPPTPKRSERIAKTSRASRLRIAESVPSRSPSLGISDPEEISSVKLVIELDAGKVNSSDYMRPSISPDKKAQKHEALDCIIVGDTTPRKSSKKGSSKTKKSGSASTAQLAEEHERIPSSQPKLDEARSKRKRRASKSETSSRKRRQRSPVDEAEATPEVPNSQPLASKAVVEPSPTREGTTMDAPVEASSSFRSELGQATQKTEDDQNLVDFMDIESSQVHDLEAQFQMEIESRSQRASEEKREATPARNEAEGPAEVGRDEPVAGPSQSTQEQATPSRGYVQKFIQMLRGGAQLLLSAPQLSTEEAWQAEEALMEVTNALYEAKRRGRR